MHDVRLINANELLRVIDEEIEYGAEYAAKDYQLINKGLKIARKDIKCAPTIDAQPVKRGKWRKRMSIPDSVKCCLCGYASVQESSYCGGCGAFMRGDNDVG